jgi:hypothetical protein
VLTGFLHNTGKYFKIKNKPAVYDKQLTSDLMSCEGVYSGDTYVRDTEAEKNIWNSAGG